MNKELDKFASQVSEWEENDIIRQLKQDVLAGKNWYIALLEAIGRWTVTEETIGGRTYRYLIAGEAFDWLMLAERLCRVVDGMIPEDEKLRLLFYGKAPVNLTTKEFQTFIGEAKYRQYLNFFYGISVEEALFLSAREEIRKEDRMNVFHKKTDYEDEAYSRIYGETKGVLLKKFRHGKGYPQRNSISLDELREFTYWLFKYRLEHVDRSRVASDTRKAMEYLREQYLKSLHKSSGTEAA
jgi:hypothetical protein